MTSIAGHLAHIYENRALTLGQIKSIFLGVSAGSLQTEEKLDGWNSYISADRTGKVRFARSKQDLQEGGLTLTDISKKEYSSEHVKQTYIKVVSEIQKAMNGVHPIVRNKVLENAFLNVEIIGKYTKRLIPYTENVISVHRTGHISKKAIDFELLKEFLEVLNQNMASEFSFSLTPTVKIEKKSINFENLDKTFGNDNKKTIFSVLEANLNQILTKLEPKTRQETVERLLHKPGAKNVTEICRNQTMEQQLMVQEAIKNEYKLISRALEPIKSSILTLENQILTGLKSHFVSDYVTGLQSLTSEYHTILEKIKSHQHFKQEINEFLTENQAEICSPNSLVEGLVFQFEGKPFKITGNFANLNQIMGLYEFGRGKIPSLKSKSYDLAIFPGSFTPPHAGHMGVVQKCISMSERLIIVKSKQPRFTSEGQEVGYDPSIKLFNYFISSAGLKSKVEIRPCETESPVRDVYKYVAEQVKPGSKVLIVCGNKHKDAERYATIQKYAKSGVTVEVLNVEPITEGSLGVLSSSKMRDAIKNLDELKKYLPKELQGETFKVQNILMNKLTTDDIIEIVSETIRKQGDEWCLKSHTGKNLGCYGSRAGAEKREKQVNYFKHQDESLSEGKVYRVEFLDGTPRMGPKVVDVAADRVANEKEAAQDAFAMTFNWKVRPTKVKSVQLVDVQTKDFDFSVFDESTSMGAGAVQGTPGPFKKKSRKKFVQELNLKEMLETLTEADEGDIPRSSTAINVLADLLKQILPTIRDGYKDLTTSHDQRVSFKAHIINAIENSLKSEKVNEDVSVDVGGKPQKDLDDLTKLKHDDIPELIDIDDTGDEGGDEKEKFAKGLEKHKLDLTGRNMAFDTFGSVETSILDAYEVLGNPEDKATFEKYLLANIKLYCDRWESELSVVA